MKMPMKEYLSRPEPGASTLSLCMENARKCELKRQGKIDDKTEDTDIGEVLHTIILEPENKDSFVIRDDIHKDIIELSKLPPDKIVPIVSESKRHGEYQKAKKFYAQSDPSIVVVLEDEYRAIAEYKKLAGKIILNSYNWNTVQSLYQKAMALENFKKYLDGGIKEQTFFGEIEGVKVKCRPDLMYFPNGKESKDVIVFDLKSMVDPISDDAFAKCSAKYNYYMSEVLYRNVLSQNDFNVIDYAFAVASKTDWSGADYFRHDQIALMEGEKLLRNAAKKYKHCMDSGQWIEKQYDFHDQKFSVVRTVTLPTWIFYKYQLPQEM